MRAKFPLFQSHIDLAHAYWQEMIRTEDLVIDATCGNGHDTLFLAQLGARVIAIDAQQEAIIATRGRVQGSADAVSFYQQCHSAFPAEVRPGSVKLIVYNLGYLPGGDKSKTTVGKVTLTSLKNALPLLCEGGAVSITCYPGHAEGRVEEGMVVDFAATLDPTQWSCCHHRWVNRHAAPSLLLFQKTELVCCCN